MNSFLKQVSLFLFLTLLVYSSYGKNIYNEPCYSSSCDYCIDECYDYCDGLYAVSSSYCWNGGSDEYPQYYVDCYCEFTTAGYFISIFFPVLFLCWCCFAIVVGGFIIRQAGVDAIEKRNLVKPSEHSFYVYRALPSCFISFLYSLLSCLTCGIFLPFLVIHMIKNFYAKFWFAGEEGEFDGKPMDYCLSVFCVNNILTVATCGIWLCFGCAERRQGKWIDENTHVRGNNQMRGDSFVYLFQARPEWYKVLLSRIFSCITCGIAAPLFVVRNMKDTVSKMRFGTKAAVFKGDTDDYVDTICMRSIVYNMLTCCCYSICGFHEMYSRIWYDKHMEGRKNENINLHNNNNHHHDNRNTGSLPSIPPPNGVSHNEIHIETSSHQNSHLTPPPYPEFSAYNHKGYDDMN